MTSKEFADILHGAGWPEDGHLYLQHISMFLDSEQREKFLDYVGIEWWEGE